MAKTKSGRAGVPILQRRLCSGVGHSNFKLEHPTPALLTWPCSFQGQLHESVPSLVPRHGHVEDSVTEAPTPGAPHEARDMRYSDAPNK